MFLKMSEMEPKLSLINVSTAAAALYPNRNIFTSKTVVSSQLDAIISRQKLTWHTTCMLFLTQANLKSLFVLLKNCFNNLYSQAACSLHAYACEIRDEISHAECLYKRQITKKYVVHSHEIQWSLLITTFLVQNTYPLHIYLLDWDYNFKYRIPLQ